MKEPVPYPILYVDDEEPNRVAFEVAFGEHFTILTAGSGAEALELLSRRRVAVVISDQRMPGLTGAQLCGVVRDKHPDVIRVIVTAYSDIGAVLDAVNTGQVSRYVIKPWREEQMIEILRGAVDAYTIATLSRDLQARLLQQEQQATATFLLGRVLHEICQPAVAVRDNVGWLADTITELPQMVERQSPNLVSVIREIVPALEDLRQASEDLCARIDRFRQGERPSEATGAGASLETAIQAAVSITRVEIRRCARLVLDLTDKPVVLADRVQLSQVIVNLLINACEAIEPGDPDANQIAVSTFMTEKTGGFFVEDSGRGIPPELAERMFDPFVTSKTRAPGGLGLAVVRDIVESLRGRIQIVPAPRRGTRVVVELPRAD